jgi:hypothetical protein
MRKQKPERMWAIATTPSGRTGTRRLYRDTIARTRSDAIEMFGRWGGGGYFALQEQGRVAAVRVLVTIEEGR